MLPMPVPVRAMPIAVPFLAWNQLFIRILTDTMPHMDEPMPIMKPST